MIFAFLYCSEGTEGTTDPTSKMYLYPVILHLRGEMFTISACNFLLFSDSFSGISSIQGTFERDTD